ncbi:hypothetical protein C8A05DRAFT_39233 [Staphylotrichum tortipilum]|uniref:Cyanovirin-N domain-containing protein n=1 Tax=Staphylotrichum tortipilum TaxID=2831512 RepID=A0AAN6MB67_9PEZI|nr:hypothetical protein C8A05DRAFT_39233 [Staphylotrichum longicolle]
MHYSSTSENFGLNPNDGFWLLCDCQSILADEDGNKQLIPNKFGLHEWFSVTRDGQLRYGRNNGFNLLDENHVDRCNASLFGGSILTVPVKGHSGDWVNVRMCLDFFLTNEMGLVMCSEPSENLCESVAMLRVDQPYSSSSHPPTYLSGLCVGYDGMLHASQIDLNLHYGNHNGNFIKKKNGYFGDTARDFYFDTYGHFRCSLQDWYKNYGSPIDYDLWKDVKNVDGVLTIQDPVGDWDARGAFMRIMEDIPFLGYGVALADLARGDTDEARRAAAECSLSTIAAVTTFFATALLGPVGACVAAAAIGTGAMLAREGMRANMGEPSFFTKSVGAAMAEFFFSEFLVIAGIGLDSLVGSFVDMMEEDFVQLEIDSMLSKLAFYAGKKELKSLANDEFKFLMDTVLEAIRHGQSLEEAKAEIDEKIDDWFRNTASPELKKQISDTMTSMGYTWSDQTILDDIYQNATTDDFADTARLKKVIETTVQHILPYGANPYTTARDTITAEGYMGKCSLTDELVNKVAGMVLKFVYRTTDQLSDPDHIRRVRLSITRIRYTYSNDLVSRIVNELNDSNWYDSSIGLDQTMKRIFSKLPSADVNSLQKLISKSVYNSGYFETDKDVPNIEADLDSTGFVYDSYIDLCDHIDQLVAQYCALHQRVMPSAP